MKRIIDNEITLVKYYPNYKRALPWYQDLNVCMQVSKRETPYDLKLLKNMYQYLDERGHLFYIKYKNRLCGDVVLQNSGEIAIVVASEYQNQHIGRRVVNEMIKLAKECEMKQVFAEIYSFNLQSQKMFLACGFKQTEDEIYTYVL